jgi:hypothetical protein
LVILFLTNFQVSKGGCVAELIVPSLTFQTLDAQLPMLTSKIYFSFVHYGLTMQACVSFEHGREVQNSDERKTLSTNYTYVPCSHEKPLTDLGELGL